MQLRHNFIRLLTICALAALVAPVASHTARAYTLKTLYSFCARLSCEDGMRPAQSLVLDADGNLYGTAQGGAHDAGIVFRLAPDGTFRVLHNFCSEANCADGRDPTSSSLIADVSGNIYGTTVGGGLGNDAGTVFELSDNAHGLQRQLTILHSFCTEQSSCRPGAKPSGGLTYSGRQEGQLYDGTSPLYGTTSEGGGRFGGAAYSLVPAGDGTWTADVLASFCRRNCADGNVPIQYLTIGGSNFYGLKCCGPDGAGNAYRLKLRNQGDIYHETKTLAEFCFDCSGAGQTVSGLTIDPTGNLYGTSLLGGGNQCTGGGCGALYRIAPSGHVSVLYAFCASQPCSDGERPYNAGGLFRDGAGNLYGTTSGGEDSAGTVFEWNGSALQTLYSFAGSDGQRPIGGVIMDQAGNIFGTTQLGGAHQQGTVFELSP